MTEQEWVGPRDFSMLIAWVLIAAYFWYMDPTFLSSRNLSQLSIELAATAVLALGMLLVIVPGHIDLSVGSGVGLMGGIAAVLIMQQDFDAPVALALQGGCSRRRSLNAVCATRAAAAVVALTPRHSTNSSAATTALRGTTAPARFRERRLTGRSRWQRRETPSLRGASDARWQAPAAKTP
jgi:ribose/xylose/arabinose/galactoside ABC-type transport system permease subunit